MLELRDLCSSVSICFCFYVGLTVLREPCREIDAEFCITRAGTFQSEMNIQALLKVCHLVALSSGRRLSWAEGQDKKSATGQRVTQHQLVSPPPCLVSVCPSSGAFQRVGGASNLSVHPGSAELTHAPPSPAGNGVIFQNGTNFS